MPIPRHRHRASTPVGALSSMFCAMVLGLALPATAEESAALQLLRSIETLQARHGLYAPELLPPLIELGQLYGGGQCDRAIDILDLALEVSRRAEGLFNPQQLEIYTSLINCYLTLDRPADLERAQHYVLLINETQYGKDDPRLLPVLEQATERYEDAGLYMSARRLHRRALDIARGAAGDDDLSLVPPLRGLARAFRLEYAYGLALPDFIDVPYETSNLRSRAELSTTGIRLDRLGERSLSRALAILRTHAQTSRTELIDTLLELGDWYQLAGDQRNALRTYRELWGVLHASGALETEFLGTATPLLFRPRTGVALRRAPLERDDYRRYTVDMDYAVNRNGWVRDVTVTESNAPREVQDEAIEDLRYLRHRPRFVDGEPVDAAGLHYRQNIYVRTAEGNP